jgi:hypothetical protein
MQWIGHVVRIVDMVNAHTISVRSLNGENHLEDLAVNESIILKK